MEKPHPETVVEKAVAYVKDVFGIHPADATPDLEPKPAYHDTEAEITAESAVLLDPNVYAGLVPPESGVVFDPATESDADVERLNREVDEQPRQKSALELNAESVRAEDGG